MKLIKEDITSYLQSKSKDQIINDIKLINKKQLNQTLIKVCKDNDLEKAKMLIEAGADVNAKTLYTNWSSLHFSVVYNGIRGLNIINLLLENGADINAQDDLGWTPLMRICCKNNKTIVKLLLEKGADVNIQCNTGWTALMSASRNNHIGIVQLLLDANADVDLRDAENRTALYLALYHKYNDIANLLRKYGARK